MKRLPVLALALFACGCDFQPAGTGHVPQEAFGQAGGGPLQALPEGAVPQGDDFGSSAVEPPGALFDLATLQRGRKRFAIFCTPCHGPAGYGDGLVVQHGYDRPPSFHEGRHLTMQPEHIVAVVTEGLGEMPSYAAQVPIADRWAIAAYVKALQLSQTGAVASGAVVQPAGAGDLP